MELKKFGIIGQGFVGNAVYQTMKQYFEVLTYDTDTNKYSNVESVNQMVKLVNIIFICLPTPMHKDGSCDLTIITNALDSLNHLAEDDKKQLIIVIKSTIPPGTTEYLNEKYGYLNIVFNPQFLTEANAINDFRYQNRIIIGGCRPYSTQVKQLYLRAFPQTHIIKTSSTIAELVKYLTNAFLSLKVSFANQMYQLCKYLNEDYDKLIEYALFDQRLGGSH